MAKTGTFSARKTGVPHLTNGVHHIYTFQKCTIRTNEKYSIFRLYNNAVNCMGGFAKCNQASNLVFIYLKLWRLSNKCRLDTNALISLTDNGADLHLFRKSNNHMFLSCCYKGVQNTCTVMKLSTFKYLSNLATGRR